MHLNIRVSRYAFLDIDGKKTILNLTVESIPKLKRFLFRGYKFIRISSCADL
jgi:hypothetical protein